MRRGWVVLVVVLVLAVMLGCGVSGVCLEPRDPACERAAAPAATRVHEVPTVRVLMTREAGR